MKKKTCKSSLKRSKVLTRQDILNTPSAPPDERAGDVSLRDSQRATLERACRSLRAFIEAIHQKSVMAAMAKPSALVQLTEQSSVKQLGKALAEASVLGRFNLLDQLAANIPDLQSPIQDLKAVMDANQRQTDPPPPAAFNDPTLWDDIPPIGEQIKQSFLEALVEYEQQREAKRNKTPQLDPKALYMPAGWFKDEFGLTADALQGQKKRGNLKVIKQGHWNHYSVPDAMAIWPHLVTYGPKDSK